MTTFARARELTEVRDQLRADLARYKAELVFLEIAYGHADSDADARRIWHRIEAAHDDKMRVESRLQILENEISYRNQAAGTPASMW